MKLAFAALLLLGTLGVAQTPAKAPKHSAPAARRFRSGRPPPVARRD